VGWSRSCWSYSKSAIARHAKVGNLTDTRFVDQNILQLDVSMNVADGVVDVLETSHDLPEHHPYVIVGESGVTVALRDVVQGADRTILSDDVIGVGRMPGFEQRQDVFVVERRPGLGFVVQVLCFRFWIWLARCVRATYDLYGDDISRRGSSSTDGQEAALTDDRSKNITGDGLTLVIRKDDWSADVWTEGGEEESGRRRGNFAHGEGRGWLVECFGACEGPWVGRVNGKSGLPKGWTLTNRPRPAGQHHRRGEWPWGDGI
jgi:hypothetical protein